MKRMANQATENDSIPINIFYFTYNLDKIPVNKVCLFIND